VASRSSARYSHPNPEVQSSDLEHIDEMTMRAVLPTTKLAADCSRRCSSLQVSMIIFISTLVQLAAHAQKKCVPSRDGVRCNCLMISAKSGR